MKTIKIVCLLIILSSCSGYIGTIEPNYNPSNKTKEIFLNNFSKSSNDSPIFIDSAIYPFNKKINFDLLKSTIQKIDKINKNTNLFNTSDYIFYSHKKTISRFNKANQKIEDVYNLELGKNEYIVGSNYLNGQIYFISNLTKLFQLDGKKIVLLKDFDILNNEKPIYFDNKIMIFSQFGEAIQIDLNNYSSLSKGFFTLNNGFSVKSNSYTFYENISYLYNSGTLIFFDKNDHTIKNNFYIEDLNILSSVGTFNELIDSPFSYNDYLYFLDRSGLITVFDPLNFKILWEINIQSPIIDYIFSSNGIISILTVNSIYFFDANGKLLSDISHEIDRPISLFLDKNNISVINNNGIHVFDYNQKNRITVLKNKFIQDIHFFIDNSIVYIKDNKYIYSVSE
tara:strand:- start:887 stop:2077 length:1191 start_codon:yes stop_codon:yes gene_type:complete